MLACFFEFFHEVSGGEKKVLIKKLKIVYNFLIKNLADLMKSSLLTL